LKTWLSEDPGGFPSIDGLMKHADYFHLSNAHAQQILSVVVDPMDTRRSVGAGSLVGMSASELDQFAPTFEHGQMDESIALSGRLAN